MIKRILFSFAVSVLFMAIVALLMLGTIAHGQTTNGLVDRPTIKKIETKKERIARFTILTEMSMARYFDFKSTRECITFHANNCHEVELPRSIVSSPGTLASVEIASGSSEWILSNWLDKKHPKLAIFGDACYAAGLTATVLHNYSIIHSRLTATRTIQSPAPIVF